VEGTFQMRSSWHSLDRIGVTFDDERLVANAGLIAPASLAQHLELKDLIDDRVDLGDAPGRANVGHKAMTVVHAVLAGADSIDDCDVLRAGSTAAVLGHAVAAPSTVGTFLRSFSWGHARQLDSVAGEMLGRAWAAGAGSDLAGPFTIDVDSSIHETYGLQKQGGSRFGYTQVRGYHPLYAIAGADGEVLHSRLRGANSHTARGAVGFLTETFTRVRKAGVTGPLSVRGDSGFYSKKVVAACQRAEAAWSLTVKLYPNIHAAISTIPDEAWKPVPYWLDDGADVAAIDFAAFKARKTDPGIACRLVVRRTKPTPGSQLALLVDWSYHAFITDRTGDPVALDAWHRAHANCENAIRDLKYGVGLNHLPSGRFGANAAWLSLNVIAHNLSRWTVRIGGLDTLPAPHAPAPQDPTATGDSGNDQPTGRTPKSFVTTDTLRRCYLAIPGRLARSARQLTLHLPARWPRAERFNHMLDNIRSVRLVT
jgi:hypothetical protein